MKTVLHMSNKINSYIVMKSMLINSSFSLLLRTWLFRSSDIAINLNVKSKHAIGNVVDKEWCLNKTVVIIVRWEPTNIRTSKHWFSHFCMKTVLHMSNKINSYIVMKSMLINSSFSLLLRTWLFRSSDIAINLNVKSKHAIGNVVDKEWCLNKTVVIIV